MAKKEKAKITTAFIGYGKKISNIVPMPRSKFLIVMCKKCKNKQIVFSKASTIVRCKKCKEELAIPTGGEAKINARVIRVLG